MFPYQIDEVVRRQQRDFISRTERERQMTAIPSLVPQWRLWLGTQLIRLGMRIKASAYIAPAYRNIRTPNPGC